MKIWCHLVTIMTLVMINVNIALACGACSSNISSYNSGYTPYAKSHSISFTHNFRNSKIHMLPAQVMEYFLSSQGNNGHLHNVPREIDYEERFYSYELRGEFYPVKRVALSAIIPLVQRQLFEDGVRVENQIGLGDMILTGQYHVFNKMSMDSSKTGHRFSIGAGLKLPTGLYNMEGYEGIIEPARQPGTGSIDFLFNVQYLFLVKNWRVSSLVNYKINSKNNRGFKFGNQFNCSLTSFYNKSFRNFGIVPLLGLNLDMAGTNKLHGEDYLIDSGSKFLSAMFGLDLYYKGMGLNFTYFLPAFESLNGVQFKTGQRFSATVRYVFQKTNYGRKKTNINYD